MQIVSEKKLKRGVDFNYFVRGFSVTAVWSLYDGFVISFSASQWNIHLQDASEIKRK